MAENPYVLFIIMVNGRCVVRAAMTYTYIVYAICNAAIPTTHICVATQRMDEGMVGIIVEGL